MFNLILFIIAIVLAYKVYENVIKMGCKCENCGKTIKCDDEFCIFCGAKNVKLKDYVKWKENKNTNQQNQTTHKPQTKNPQKQHYNYYEIIDDLDGVIVSLMAKVTKDDGIISNNETEYISQRYKELATLTNKTFDVIEIYKEIFEREKNRTDNIQELSEKLKDLDESAKAYILKILNELAEIGEGENETLKQIKEFMNLPNHKSNSFYEILNSKPTDDWETIKHNYKELVKQYHYDKLASKNLPKDLLEYAENRLKEINEAYESLKKLKGQI
jgi:DnaJ like chaperone protein